MSLLSSILLLLVSARLLGSLFAKFGQPVIIGEMIAGLIIGPAGFNILTSASPLHSINELAIFLIVLAAGLEMDFREVMSGLLGKGAVIGILGFVLPLLSGFALGAMFDLDAMRTIFLGLCISITALPVAARILKSFNLLQSPIGKYSISTGILNDVAALLALGVILNMPAKRDFSAIGSFIGISAGKLVLLGIIIIAVNYGLEQAQKRGLKIQKIPEKLVNIFGPEALFGLVVSFVLIFSALGEALGFHFVIGAFFGGLILSHTFFFESRFSELEKTLNSVNDGFLAPVFFASLGLDFSIESLKSWDFILIMLILSIGSKVFAGWLGARLIGMPNREALGVGIIINGRGVVSFVVANIAYEKGFIGSSLFSTIILMGVFTTLVTPWMFGKFVLEKAPKT